MAAHTQIGGVVVDAFQWNGGLLASYALPWWANGIALQTPGDGNLDVPTPRGTFMARPADWVVRYAVGHIEIMGPLAFASLYT